MKLARSAAVASALVGALALATMSGAFAADKAKAEKDLKAALAAGNAEGTQAACDQLLEVGGKDALKVLLDLAPKLDGVTYWQVTGAASGFQDGAALEELGKFVVAHQADAKSSLSRDLLFGLQNNHSPHVIGALAVVLEKGKYDLQLMAVDQLTLVRSVESVDALVAAAKKEDKGDAELRQRILNALRMLTGENFNDGATWEIWWKDQRAKGIPEKKSASSGAGGAPATMEKPRDNEFGQTIEKLGPERIIVLTGCYDQTEHVLDEHKIPHTVVKKTDFDSAPQKYLKDAYAMLINCDDCYEGVAPGAPNSGGKKLSPGSLDAIKNWVENQGGFIFTEDWGLIDVTAVLWPDKVSTFDGKVAPAIPAFLDEATVKLTPVKGNTSHPLMRGVWQKPKKEAAKVAPGEEGKTVEKVESPATPLNHTWKVDNLSAAIKIVDTANVIPLLESEELEKAKNATRAVAVTFRVGTWQPKTKGTATGGGASGGGSGGTKTQEFASHAKGGRVLHTISHFGHQSSKDDGQALHNLLINFLLEAAKHHEGVVAAADGKKS